ncbi:hypothetical protein STEG23_003727, partial [Scotinomys teguina]
VYIYWFSCVEPSLHLWVLAYLIMMNDILDVFLNLVWREVYLNCLYDLDLTLVLRDMNFSLSTVFIGLQKFGMSGSFFCEAEGTFCLTKFTGHLLMGPACSVNTTRCQAVQLTNTKRVEAVINTMNSYPLKRTRSRKERVLDQIQKESTTSADHKADIKAVLNKIDCQGEENIKETLEKVICASHQNDTSFEDLANADENMLDLSTALTSLRKCCAHKHPGQPLNFNSRARRPEEPRDGQQQKIFKKFTYMLNEFLDLVKNVLVSY